MRIIADTHVVLWFITDDKRLPPSSYGLIEDTQNDCFVSIASLWEVGIKHSLGRLEISSGLEDIFYLITRSGFDLLPVAPEHILAASSLEFHHKDPFDRLIIGQAKSEQLSVVTKDAMFGHYNIDIIWSR